MQQRPAPAYGMSKAQYARMVADYDAERAYQAREGLFTRLRKRFR